MNLILFISLFFAGISCALVEFNPEVLEEFRVGKIRTVNITVPAQSQPTTKCGNENVCEILATEKIGGNNSHDTFSIQIKPVFIGITKLEFTIGDQTEEHEIRVLRAEVYVVMAKSFVYVAALFVGFVTFLMGTQLEWRRIRKVLRRPIGPLIGFVCQFGLMPLTGFLLAKYGFSKEEMVLQLALFVASTCPGGGKSSFWTIIYGGNLDLSVAMTFTQTIAALFMMPLWLSTLGRQFTSKRIDVPFLSIAEGLAALLIPSSLGMYFIHTRPHLVKKIELWIKRISWTATLIFSFFAVYANWYVISLFTWKIVLIGCILPWSGYITAFITATVFRQEFKDKITIAIETGVQNIGIATIIMMWSLQEPEVDISLTILFAILLSTDKPLIIIYVILKLCKKLRKKKEFDSGEKENNTVELQMELPTETTYSTCTNSSTT